MSVCHRPRRILRKQQSAEQWPRATAKRQPSNGGHCSAGADATPAPVRHCHSASPCLCQHSALSLFLVPALRLRLGSDRSTWAWISTQPGSPYGPPACLQPALSIPIQQALVCTCWPNNVWAASSPGPWVLGARTAVGPPIISASQLPLITYGPPRQPTDQLLAATSLVFVDDELGLGLGLIGDSVRPLWCSKD